MLEWRVQNYSLADPIYFSWNESGDDRAFVVCQYNSKEILLLDQRFTSRNALKKITNQIIQWSISKNIFRLTAETSCIKSQDVFLGMIPGKKIKNEVCYFFPREIFSKIDDIEIIITPLSSDILLR